MRYVGRGEPARPQLTTSAEQMSQMSAGDVVIDATVPDDDGPALPAPFMRSIEDLQTALVVHIGLISDHTATMTAMMARDVVVDAIKDQLSKALKRIADLSELALTNKQAAEHRHHVKRYLEVDDDVAWQALKRIADGHGSEVRNAAQSPGSSTDCQLRRRQRLPLVMATKGLQGPSKLQQIL